MAQADISAVATTTMQIAGAVAVAVFGTVYLTLASHPGPGAASHAFELVTAALSAVAIGAAVGAHRSAREFTARCNAR